MVTQFPYSPVHSHRKFSTVNGHRSPYSLKTRRLVDLLGLNRGGRAGSKTDVEVAVDGAVVDDFAIRFALAAGVDHASG